MDSYGHADDPAPRGAAVALQQLVVGLLISLPHVKAAWIMMPDGFDSMRVDVRALAPACRAAEAGIIRLCGLLPAADAWERDAPLVLDFAADRVTEPALAACCETAREHGWGSSILVPLRGRKVPGATLVLCADRSGHFSMQPVRSLLTQIETDLGAALDEQTDHAATQRTQLLYQALFMGGEALLSARTERAALRGICRRLVQSGLFVAAALGQPDKERTFRYDLASAGSGSKPAAQMVQHVDAEGPDLLLGLQAWRQHMMVITNDYMADQRLQRWRHLAGPENWRAAAAVPIHREGTVWAILLVAADQRDVFDQGLIDLVKHLAILIGRALDEIDLKARLQQSRELQSRLARQDSLTGLPNRIALLERLPRILARARRTGGRVAIGILDLDDFKPVNDSWGHAAGDMLLRAFSQRLQDAVRETDLVIRLGGDEFVVILDNINSPDDLPAALARLHAATTAPYALPDSKQAQISLSLGLTLYPEDQSEPEILLRHADEALYAVKARKIRRRQFWMLWSTIPDPAESSTRDDGTLAVPLYGSEAAMLLNRAREALLRGTDVFIEAFYETEACESSVAAILARMNATELQSLRAEQRSYLQRLVSPELTGLAHHAAARRAGRLHALAGLSTTTLVAALQLFLDVLLGHVRALSLWRTDRMRLTNLLTQRVSVELAQQMEGANGLILSWQQFLVRLNSDMPGFTSWHDFMREVVAHLVLQDGIVAAATTRLDYHGKLIYEYTAGTFDAFVSALESHGISSISVDPTHAAGQSPHPRAWRSECIETNPSYISDPRMASWRDAAHSVGIRSSAALPLKDVQGRMFATLALYSDIPGLFETPQARMFAESLGNLISQGQHQLSPKHLAAPIPAAERREYRQRLYNHHLEMHYQPIVDLRGGKPIKAEALARLRLRDGSLANPQQFLAGFGQAEMTRLFLEGLDHALAQLQSWDARGLSLGVSLNLPPSVLVDRQCCSWVQKALQAANVPPRRLFLEVLESEELHEATRRDMAVAALAASGVHLVMDDLGSGYSSLLRLRTLPFHTVKIDQELVSETHRDPHRVISFIGSLVRLAQSLELRVVVEGLETAGLIEAAAILGADAGQGYGIARPMAAPELFGWAQQFSLSVPPSPHTELGEMAALWCQDHRLTRMRRTGRKVELNPQNA